jgi:hypothetical protein
MIYMLFNIRCSIFVVQYSLFNIRCSIFVNYAIALTLSSRHR